MCVIIHKTANVKKLSKIIVTIEGKQSRKINLKLLHEVVKLMILSLPYAWQEKGQPIEIFLKRDKKVNLFGFFRGNNVAIT